MIDCIKTLHQIVTELADFGIEDRYRIVIGSDIRLLILAYGERVRELIATRVSALREQPGFDVHEAVDVIRNYALPCIPGDYP